VRQAAAYPSYKDSGVEWLGKIPEHWMACRLKTVLAQPVTDGPHETPDFLPDGVPFLSVDGIQDGELVFEGCRHIDLKAHEQYRRKCAPRRDDILVGKAASTGKIARVKVDIEFSIWSPLAVVRPRADECVPGYLEYALKSTGTQAQIDILCTSNTQKNISMADIPRITFALPRVVEQEAIAKFLDHETAKIDALMEKKDRLIELLQEKRTALITHAVTKGNIPVKDSGVEWLGEIPAHWEPRRLKVIADVNLSNVDKKTQEGQEPVLLCNYVDVYKNERITPELEFMSATASPEQIKRFSLQKGDVLITKDSELWDDIAVSACVVHEMPDVLCGYHLALIRPEPSRVVGSFLSRAFSAVGLRDQLWVSSNGITRYGLTGDAISTALFPIPPVEEQQVIADFLDRETTKIDTLISKVQEAIERLKEYRIALISAAVTGKIDVGSEVRAESAEEA
jgi:type I restriction enzyme S subunit